MPASSPYQNNDYQALSVFRPYQLPVNDIFKAYSSLNAAWDQGALGVKGAYENALQLNLLTDNNRERRDQFMEQATKQVHKMASMDLSNPSIQREGINIFSPLFKDQDIVGEDFVVRNLNQEISKGLATRTSGDGKQWNPLSIENLQIEKSFLSGELNKRDGWKSLYQNMSTYSPNYDGTAELKKITDLLKAKEIEDVKLAGNDWYIEIINKKGVSKERINQAIQEMGSPQLKAQMRVEGRNTFYKVLKSNPESVDGFFQGVAANVFNQKINDLKNNKAELAYQASIVPNTPENTKVKKSYEDALSSIDKTITNLQNVEMPKAVAEYTNLSNLDYLSANLSKVERLWETAKIDQLSSQLAWESSIRGIKMNQTKAAQENIKIAAERINYNYAALRQDQTQFEALNKADENGTPKPGASGKSFDELTGGTSPDNNGWIPTTLPSQDSPEGIKANQAAARDRINSEYEAKDENVRNAGVKFLFGQSVQERLDQGMREGARSVTDNNILYDNDIEDAADLILSYTAKHKIKVPGQRQLTPFTSVSEEQSLSGDKESIKQWIKSASPAQFKKLIGDISLQDDQFISDWTIKKVVEGGTDAKSVEAARRNAIEFRASIAENQRITQSMSDNILKDQVKALGSLSRYFDNNGEVPLTDKNITAAYERFAPENSLWMSDNGRTRLATAAEVEKYNAAGGGYGVNFGKNVYPKKTASGRNLWRPSKEDFIKSVRMNTDPIYHKYSVDTNQASKVITLPKKADKANEFSKLKSILQYQNSDNSGNIEDMLTFIESHIDNFSGATVFTPSGKTKTPTVKINMQGLTDKAAEEWDKYSNVIIPAAPKDPNAYQVRTLTSDVTAPGSYVFMSNVSNGDGPTGTIKIRNQSSSQDRQEYHVYVDNVYMLDPITKSPVNITGKVIRDIIENGAKKRLEDMDAKTLNLLLSEYLMNIEFNNKRIKEQK